MAITYDAVACQVWIDLLSTFPVGGQVLCSDHAERLSPPRGWVIVDRRDPQSAIVAAAPPMPPVAPRTRPLRRSWGQFDAPRLEFTGPVTVISSVVATATVVPAPPLEPRLEPLPDRVEHDADAGRTPGGGHEPEPAPASPTTIEAEHSPADDLTDLLRPTGRLLSRAFESGGEQKSVLNVHAPDEAPRSDVAPGA